VDPRYSHIGLTFKLPTIRMLILAR
jgi:hypothetical protein